MLFHIFLSLALATIASGDCVILNNGTLPPQQATGDATTPIDYSATWTQEPACPEFYGKPSCCTDASNSAALENFQKIGTAFGNAGAGCDLCAANIRRFFCYFGCDPNQSDWMKFNDFESYEIWNSTSNQVQNITVVNVSMAYNADEACSLFGSCSKISFLTEISAGGSALGYFTFLFDRGIEDSSIKVLVSMNNTGGMKFTTPPHHCNESYPDGFDELGYPVPGTCPCNYCEDACEPLQYAGYGGLTDGFNSYSVILGYVFAFVLTVGMVLYRGFRKQQHNRQQRSGLLHDETSRDE